MNLLLVASAFVRKDFLEDVSYRLNFLMTLGSTLVTLLFVAMVSDFVGPLVGERLKGQGSDYFSFAVVGVSLHSFLQALLVRLSSSIRGAQVLGTLEAVIATRANLGVVIVCMPLYSILQTSVRVLLYFGLGHLLFGMQLQLQSWMPALVVLALTALAFASLGLLTASLTIVFKRADQLGLLVAGLAFFLGGVYYPVDVLPEWLRTVGQAVPLTPALQALRRLLLEGEGWEAVRSSVLSLALFALVCTPLSMWTFRWAVRRAMRDGTLTQY